MPDETREKGTIYFFLALVVVVFVVVRTLILSLLHRSSHHHYDTNQGNQGSVQSLKTIIALSGQIKPSVLSDPGIFRSAPIQTCRSNDHRLRPSAHWPRGRFGFVGFVSSFNWRCMPCRWSHSKYGRICYGG